MIHQEDKIFMKAIQDRNYWRKYQKSAAFPVAEKACRISGKNKTKQKLAQTNISGIFKRLQCHPENR